MDRVYGAFGLDAGRAATYLTERTVLAVAHHMTAASRLADIIPLVESDPRVQVVYTCPPGALHAGWVAQHLASLDAMVVPWQQATQTRFDLAVAASWGQLERLHAPVMVFPHGIGFNKYAARWAGPGPEAARSIYGMEQAVLVYRGRVVPSAILVPTKRDAARLRRSCPQAAPVTEVAGDPAYDRLAASLPSRALYRAALGVADRSLVVVASTWGEGSLLRCHPSLPGWLARELPVQRFAVAATVHPAVWSWYGRRQVRAWFADAIHDGLILLPPEEGWRAALAAADYVIGDHGSSTCYGASIGRPVLLASFPEQEIVPSSAAALVGAVAPRLRIDEPVPAQLAAAAAVWTTAAHARIRGRVTDMPGQAAQAIMAIMYRLMDLAAPTAAPTVRPVPTPVPAGPPR